LSGKHLESSSKYFEDTFIRDPLYGFISLSKRERNLISSSVMQRLTRIKQLAHTYMVYPSAAHTRFEHSLGALYVAGRVCDRFKLREKDTQIIRIGALLHDVGHGPFSHVFEEIIGETAAEQFSHEKITQSIIETNAELKNKIGTYWEELINVLRTERETVRSEILSGSLDCDKLDYLRRDSYHTGVAYGVFDFERVVRNVCAIKDGERTYIGISDKGKDAIESYRMARYLMHAQVYEHHARLVADDMFLRAVSFALDEGVLDHDALNPKKDLDHFLRYYLSLDDYSIQHQIINNSTGKAKKVMEDLLNRNLLKRAYMIPLSKEAIPDFLERRNFIQMSKKEIKELECKIGNKAGLEDDRLILHFQSIKIKLYEHFEEVAGERELPILVQHYDGSVGNIEDESPFSASLTPIRRLYVFCPQGRRKAVSKITEDIIGIKSHYDPSQKDVVDES